ncbi:universal stress protein [Oceanobacillus damuensis]|uniref:universal stress protein n=1 Tax=Oceanobacillus damuensis TaxID=937928 RepID=UPI00082F994C|nr:universal stress protein [Oceanobacillus damuensis]
MFKRILLAVDGSIHSVRAAEYAVGLAKKFDSEIAAVYVVDGDTAKQDVLQGTSEFQIEAKRRGKIKPIRKLLDGSGVSFKTHILHGDPGPTIVDFANKNQFDCVLIGSRGLNNFQSFLLGSVSHKVAKRVQCPVLIVK